MSDPNLWKATLVGFFTALGALAGLAPICLLWYYLTKPTKNKRGKKQNKNQPAGTFNRVINKCYSAAETYRTAGIWVVSALLSTYILTVHFWKTAPFSSRALESTVFVTGIYLLAGFFFMRNPKESMSGVVELPAKQPSANDMPTPEDADKFVRSLPLK